MPLIATIVALIFGFITFSTEPPAIPSDNTTAWDRLHPASQKYLNENAKYYLLDELGNIWNRKLAMEDRQKLLASDSKRDEILFWAQCADNAPAWFCLDTDAQFNMADGPLEYIAQNINHDTWQLRRDYLRTQGFKVFVSYEFLGNYQSDPNETYGMHVIYPIGILADEQGETFIARVDNLPFDDLLRGITNKSDQYIGESFELAYRIDFKDFHKFSPESSFGDMKVIGPHEWIPRFEINTEFPLSRDDDIYKYTLRKPTDLSFSPLTPIKLANVLASKNINTLPEWVFKKKPNKEFFAWEKAANGSDSEPFKYLKTHSENPNPFIFTWTKKPIRIRFSD
ncbi:hypothetical protein COB72_01885 [bacterium]|nr:MAG: hypothetical protein COB72_01885 [bacterium]